MTTTCRWLTPNKLVTYNDDGSGLNARLDYSGELPDSCDVLQRQPGSYTARAGGNGNGWQPFSGSTVSGVLSSKRCSHYHDYNLQNIAAGTRVRVYALQRQLPAVVDNADLSPTTMTAERSQLDFIYQSMRIHATSYSVHGSHPRAQAVTASVGNLANGSAVRGVLTARCSECAALRLQLR